MSTFARVIAVVVAGLSLSASPVLAQPSPQGSWPSGALPAGIGKQAVSGLQIQNLSHTDPATIVADFYRVGRDEFVGITLPQTAALTAANVYVPGEHLRGPGSYAIEMSSDRHIAAIARTEWLDTGGAMLYSNAIADTDIIVPLALKLAGGQSSHFAIMRADPRRETNVTLSPRQCGVEPPQPVSIRLGADAGDAAHVDMGSGDEFAGVGDGFVGALRVTADAPVAVTSHVDFYRGSRAVYAFEGVPAGQAAGTLFAPLVRRDFYGTTGIAVANPGDEQVHVEVTYRGNHGSCVGGTYTQSGTVGPACSTIFYQGGDTENTESAPLPPGCVGAAVTKVVSPPDGRIMAVVNDAELGRTSAAYNAASAEQAAKTVALPLIRDGHMPSRAALTTGIQAMNVGSSPASVRLRIFDNLGRELSPDPPPFTIPVMGGWTWFPAHIEGTPNNMYGSALIESDQPLVVIVNDASFARVEKYQQDSAIYNGIKADGPSQIEGIFAPFALKVK